MRPVLSRRIAIRDSDSIEWKYTFTTAAWGKVLGIRYFTVAGYFPNITWNP